MIVFDCLFFIFKTNFIYKSLNINNNTNVCKWVNSIKKKVQLAKENFT
jgi:hypothetical protein